MEIIRHGNTRTQAICNNCNALLVYSGADIIEDNELINIDLHPGSFDVSNFRVTRYIRCPDCGEKIILNEYYSTTTTPSLIGFTN